jgi:hypothetical protein
MANVKYGEVYTTRNPIAEAMPVRLGNITIAKSPVHVPLSSDTSAAFKSAVDAVYSSPPSNPYSSGLALWEVTGVHIGYKVAECWMTYANVDQDDISSISLPSPMGDGGRPSEESVRAWQVSDWDLANADTLVLDANRDPIPRTVTRSRTILVVREDATEESIAEAWSQVDENSNDPGDLVASVNGCSNAVYLGQYPLIYYAAGSYYIRKHHHYASREWLTPGITCSAHAEFEKYLDSGVWKLKVLVPTVHA